MQDEGDEVAEETAEWGSFGFLSPSAALPPDQCCGE